MKYKTKNVCTANDKINEDKKLKKKRKQNKKLVLVINQKQVKAKNRKQ